MNSLSLMQQKLVPPPIEAVGFGETPARALSMAGNSVMAGPIDLSCIDFSTEMGASLGASPKGFY